MKYSFEIMNEAQVDQGDVFQITLFGAPSWFDRLLGKKGYKKNILMLFRTPLQILDVLEGDVTDAEHSFLEGAFEGIYGMRLKTRYSKIRLGLIEQCKKAIEGERD